MHFTPNLDFNGHAVAWNESSFKYMVFPLLKAINFHGLKILINFIIVEVYEQTSKWRVF